MINVFIIGSKGIPSKYGGFETFVDKLTEYKKSSNIKYHVSCLANNFDIFEYNGARCFNVKVPNIGSAKAIYYDLKSLDLVYKYIKNNNVSNSLVYILACRIGPFMNFYKKKFNKLGIPVFVNPDGHEWKRAKWNWLVKQYWKFSERLMIKNTDLVICDSVAIENYIKEEYRYYCPKTIFIPYGATINIPQKINIQNYRNWLKQWGLKEKEYYLIVGRFVEENNYELMIKEFMKSKTIKSLIIVTNVEKNKFYNNLMKATKFNLDKRIKFVGTIYDQDLLYQIRKGAFGYLHGHEVGGTNPSLLEAMATTSLNLLLDVKFNREVGDRGAFYFEKKPNSLSNLIDSIDRVEEDELVEKESLAKLRIKNYYEWDLIVGKYEDLFLGKIEY